jgi:DNA-binding XRE family transcriptional regulator
MDRQAFITACDTNVKMVRAEMNLTQEQMSEALGISKKTLVDIEKGRRSLGWTTSVALTAIFTDSRVLTTVFGGAQTELIQELSSIDFLSSATRSQAAKPATSMWWTVIADNGEYTIEQNTISQHYRLLDRHGVRIMSSFDIDDLLAEGHFEQPR